jgi:type IV pilus assembly protein PilX
MYALRHKPVPTPALAGNCPPSERGVVLLVALIILVALTLAGVALIRSVDTANIIAGNLSFRESAVHAGERSTQTAIINFLQPNNTTGNITLHSNNAANGYSAVRVDRDVENDEAWETFWTRVTTAPGASADGGLDDAGNTVRYVIHRLCETTGAPHIANCAKSPASANTGGSFGAGGLAQIASNQVYYRITTRIAGPRNTVAYLQTVVAL